MNDSFQLVHFCELDKFATISYCAIHDTPPHLNLGDITQVDENSLKPFNMICGGSPCQDFSVAGTMSGNMWQCSDCGMSYNPLYVHYAKRDYCPKCGSTKINKSKSSLLVEWLRIIRANKPKWGIYENVKNLVGKRFLKTFRIFLDELQEYGYNTYYQVLNAKDFGVPQNRERVFVIFVLKEYDNGQFTFPTGFDSKTRLRDFIEKQVNEKYYINSSKADALIKELLRSGSLDEEHCKTANAKVLQLGNIMPTKTRKNPNQGRVYSVCGLSPTLTNVSGGGGRQPMIVERRRSLTENRNEFDYKIRKLTPKECFRLMGFTDNDFEKAKTAKVSSTQLYKQAGNSIVVDVLFWIYKNLYAAMPYLFDDLKLCSCFSGIGAFESALDRFFEDRSDRISRHLC